MDLGTRVEDSPPPTAGKTYKQTESCCPNCQGSLPQTSNTKEVVEKLLSVGLVPSIVKLASKPTHFSQKWTLADLEVQRVPRTCAGGTPLLPVTVHRCWVFRATSQQPPVGPLTRRQPSRKLKREPKS